MRITQVLVLRLGLLYLALPVLIFCATWLAWLPAVLSVAFVCIGVVKVWPRPTDEPVKSLLVPVQVVLLMSAVIAVWVALSGLGGWMFQNWDFHWRNALLRDLINQPWPVVYQPENGTEPRLLVYYLAYWLPAAAVGKAAGWSAANAALALWAAGGCMLAALGLSLFIQVGTALPIVVMVLFGGLDALGVLLWSTGTGSLFVSLWPPLQHLESWSNPLQYSSMTTQLFWIFNQAVPAWVFMILLLLGFRRSSLVYLWSLCFALTPLAAGGALPYVALRLVQGIEAGGGGQRWKQVTSVDNILGGLSLTAVLFSYFISNITVASVRDVYPPLPRLLFIQLVEWLLLWMILALVIRGDLRLHLAAVLLVLCGFGRVGSLDLGTRISIPSLFLLLAFMSRLLAGRRDWVAVVMTVYLMIAAVTPLFEINRSIVRTALYYRKGPSAPAVNPSPASELAAFPRPENAHPATLQADAIVTLGQREEFIVSYWGRENSLFYTYLARK